MNVVGQVAYRAAVHLLGVDGKRQRAGVDRGLGTPVLALLSVAYDAITRFVPVAAMETGPRTFRVVAGNAAELLVALVALRGGDDVAAGVRPAVAIARRGDEVVDDIDSLGQRDARDARISAVGVLVPVPGALPDSWIVSRCTRLGA